MSKANKIYNIINSYYGKRNFWISDIASTLNISVQDANKLTFAAGYRRGKHIILVSLHEFINNINVVYIVKKINENTIKALTDL